MPKILIDGEYYSKNMQQKIEIILGILLRLKYLLLIYLLFNDLIFLGNYTKL